MFRRRSNEELENMLNLAFLSERKFLHPNITPVSWTSTRSLLDFDGVIVDAESYFQDSSPSNVYTKLQVLQKRTSEIADYALHDRPLILLLAHTPTFSFNRPGQVARNFSVAERLYRCELKDQSGLNISVLPDAPVGIKEFFSAAGNYLQFRATISDTPGVPLFVITGTNAVLGCKVNLFKSEKTYFLPSFAPKVFAADASMRQVGDAFKVLFEWVASSSVRAKFDLPPNHDRYKSPQEISMSNALQDLEGRKKKIDEEIVAATDAITYEHMLKHLFLSNGDALAEATKMALIELGFNTINGPDGRDDLMCLEEVPPMVIEVKGRETKSAKEADCAQLEKWAATYLENHEIQPKPLLVVNGFFHIALRDRTEPVFPHQMLKYATQRNHALISGLDLYRLLLWARSDPGKKLIIRDRLKNAAGCVDLTDVPKFPSE